MWGIGLKRFRAEGFRAWGEKFECKKTIFSFLERGNSRVQGVLAGRFAALMLQKCISCLLVRLQY